MELVDRNQATVEGFDPKLLDGIAECSVRTNQNAILAVQERPYCFFDLNSMHASFPSIVVFSLKAVTAAYWLCTHKTRYARVAHMQVSMLACNAL